MTDLGNNEELKKIDTQDMYGKIIHFPEHIIKAYSKASISLPENFNNKIDIDKILICGMGGSAISGDIIKASYEKNIPIEVVKNYIAPKMNEKVLLIACSYSGNTEETLSIVDSALKSNAIIAGVTSGGKLKELIGKNSMIVNLPGGYPPRSAVGYLLFSIVKVLEEYKIIPSQKEVVDKIIAQLIKKAGAIAYNEDEKTNIAKYSARKLVGKIPLVYSEEPNLFPLAYRWKCQINENAKHPAFCHSFPEFSHNEIEGWESMLTQKMFMPIFLQRFSSDKRHLKHMNAFKTLLSNNNIQYLEFFVEGDTIIEEICSLIYLGDMISFYLAILQDTDPTPIKFINFIKESFKKLEE